MSQSAPPNWSKDDNDDDDDTYNWDKADSVAVKIRQVNWNPDQYDVWIIDEPAFEKQIPQNISKSQAESIAEEVMNRISDKYLDILNRRSSNKPADEDFNPPQERVPHLAALKVAENY